MIWEYVPLLVTSVLFALLAILLILLPQGAARGMKKLQSIPPPMEPIPKYDTQLDLQVKRSQEISRRMAMPGANTWLVKMNEQDVEIAQYGDPIQCVVAADTPEEARSLGADMLKKSAETLTAQPYNLGFSASGE